MAQQTVTQFATPGFVGYLAEQRASDVTKGGPLVQNETIELARGLVLDSSAPFAVMLPTGAAGEVFAGVAYNAYTQATALQNNAPVPSFTQGSSVTYVARGVIYVAPETNITAGVDAVYLRVTASGLLTPGGFGNTADTGNCVLLSNCRWLTSGSAGDPCKLEINTP